MWWWGTLRFYDRNRCDMVLSFQLQLSVISFSYQLSVFRSQLSVVYVLTQPSLLLFLNLFNHNGFTFEKSFVSLGFFASLRYAQNSQPTSNHVYIKSYFSARKRLKTEDWDWRLKTNLIMQSKWFFVFKDAIDKGMPLVYILSNTLITISSIALW